jgi:hypothetical protein
MVCNCCITIRLKICLIRVFFFPEPGALTIMLVLDQKDALNLMENLDPLLLLVGLPLIPFVIVASRFIRWEDTLLKYWRKYSPQLIGRQNCKFF